MFELSRRTSDPLLSLHWLAGEAPARLGLAVSRKVDPRAVGRHRIKRILRDDFRRRRALLQPGAYVLVVRGAAAKADGAVLRQAFERLLRRAGALPVPATVGTMRPACQPPTASPSNPDA